MTIINVIVPAKRTETSLLLFIIARRLLDWTKRITRTAKINNLSGAVLIQWMLSSAPVVIKKVYSIANPSFSSAGLASPGQIVLGPHVQLRRNQTFEVFIHYEVLTEFFWAAINI